MIATLLVGFLPIFTIAHNVTALVDFLLSWDGKDEEQETAEEYGLVDVHAPP